MIGVNGIDKNHKIDLFIKDVLQNDLLINKKNQGLFKKFFIFFEFFSYTKQPDICLQH